jgi:hypothetical protein
MHEMSLFASKAESRIFLTCWMIYLLFMVPEGQSLVYTTLDLSTSIVDRFSFELDQNSYMDTVVRNGKSYSGFPPGNALLGAAVYGLLAPIINSFDKSLELLLLHIATILFVTAPFASYSAVLLYRLLGMMSVPKAHMTLAALLYSFGTMQFGYATAFYKNGTASYILFSAFFLAYRIKRSKTRKPAPFFLLGFLLGFSILVDYPATLIAAIVFSYILVCNRSRSLFYTVLGGAAPMLFLLFYQKLAFGAYLLTSYHSRASGPDVSVFTYPSFHRLLELLFSPTYGFFIYTPIMFMIFSGFRQMLRGDKENRAEIATIAAIIIFQPLFFTGWWVMKTHEASLCSRFLLAVVPFSMIPIAFSFTSLSRTVVMFLAVPSVVFSYLGTQAGVIPSSTTPLVYASKVFVSSFGMGQLFSDLLPRLAGVDTFHTYVSRPEIRLGDLFEPASRHMLAVLLTNQSIFFALWLLVLTLVFLILKKMWYGHTQTC